MLHSNALILLCTHVSSLHSRCCRHAWFISNPPVSLCPRNFSNTLETTENRFGVAAVTYRAGSGLEERDTLGETTTTMMGCRCTDNAGLPPIRIQCALALKTAGTVARAASVNSAAEEGESSSFMQSAASANVFDVIFQQRSTANYMTCKMTQISVQSVRWPATRFSGRYVQISPVSKHFQASINSLGRCVQQ